MLSAIDGANLLMTLPSLSRNRMPVVELLMVGQRTCFMPSTSI